MHAASLCAAFGLHIRNTFCNENKPSLDLSSASCQRNHTGERRRFQQRVDRFWTSAGMERLAVGRMSQSSRTESERDGGGVLNSFILHYYGQSCSDGVFACEGNKHTGSHSKANVDLSFWELFRVDASKLLTTWGPICPSAFIQPSLRR